jgi:hypothetical protein
MFVELADIFFQSWSSCFCNPYFRGETC